MVVGVVGGGWGVDELIKYSMRFLLNNHLHTSCAHWAKAEIRYKMRDDLNGAAVEVWEWTSNFTPHLTGYVIIHPC